MNVEMKTRGDVLFETYLRGVKKIRVLKKERNQLKARVAELEVEEKQVCEWKCVKYSPPGFKQYWIYYPPHNVSYWISAIGKEDYIFCPSCGKRVKYVEE